MTTALKRTSGPTWNRATFDLPLPWAFGVLAGVNRPHPFRPLSLTQCTTCFGWRDDPRHWAPTRVVRP